jgi:hypothetical protein
MKSEDIRKLLGGYAAGILTEEERQALFEAALADQELFNELAGEQALKELLEDDRARRQLLHALGEREPLTRRFREWMGRPLSWALAGGLAAVVVLVAVFVRTGTPPTKVEPQLVAMREAVPKPDLERREAPAQAVPVRKPLPKAKALPSVPPLPSAPPPLAAPTVVAAPPAENVEVAMAKDEGRARLAKSEPPAMGVTGGAYQRDKALLRTDYAAQPLPIRYRLLRRDAEGNYAEVDAQTIFQSSDLIRVAFELSDSGLLQVTSIGAGGSSEVVFNRSVQKGATYNLDVPAGEVKLVAAFARQTPQGSVTRPLAMAGPAAQSAPVTIEIPIRRQPAP